MKSVVIIPTFNEEKSIGAVLRDIPARFNDCVFVADNGSTDSTSQIARNFGAHVVVAPRRGYGSACLAAIKAAKSLKPDIFIFLDGDYSDYPEDMTKIYDKLNHEKLDLVIGTRMTDLAEPGSLLPQARFGNWLATKLMFLRYGYRFSDLGPFRAIRTEALDQLQMTDPDFGWTVEMQIKALKMGLSVAEVPVRYRRRIGHSKITGTLSGTIRAGLKILWVIFRHSINFPFLVRSPHESKTRIY